VTNEPGELFRLFLIKLSLSLSLSLSLYDAAAVDVEGLRKIMI